MSLLGTIKEALTDQQKAIVARWPAPSRHAVNATNHYFGSDSDDKFEKLEGTQDKSEIHKAIEQHLGTEIHPDDYKAGTTKDKYGRSVKIGSLLSKSKAPPHLINGFANDNTRQGNKYTGLTVHTTRSKEGVAGQTSGGQSWEQQSCKNFTTGVNRHYLPKEVQAGTVVSYLKDHTGKELARATFQPHQMIGAPSKTMYRINSYYGIDHAGFKQHNLKTEKELSTGPTNGFYRIHPDVYDDSGDEANVHLHPDIGVERLHKLSRSDDAAKAMAAVSHPKADSLTLHNGLKHPDEFLAGVALNHPNIDSSHVGVALQDEDPYIQEIAAKHPAAHPDDLSYLLKTEQHSIPKMAVFSNPSHTREHVELGMKDADPSVAASAWGSHHITAREITDKLANPGTSHLIPEEHMENPVYHIITSNPNVNRSHLSQILNHQEKYDEIHVVPAAAAHAKAAPEHIETALNSDNSMARKSAIGNHGKTTPEQIDRAMKDPWPSVRVAALRNPQSTAEHATLGINDEEDGVRAQAAKHPLLNSEGIHKALGDSSPVVRQNAADHPNATPEHIDKALGDRNHWVRANALSNPNATRDHYDRGIKDGNPFVRENAHYLGARLGFNEENHERIRQTIKIIREALTDEHKIQVANWEDAPAAIKSKTDHYFGKDSDDRFEKLGGTQDKSEVHKEVERHLETQIHPDDYKAGLMKDKYGRSIKIGSALTKAKAPQELVNNFANDNTRQGKKFTGLTVHTTRSKEGVAGQTSPGQSWVQQSCKNIDTGSNKHYLPKEVQKGTVVSYLKDHTGKELARATLQPYDSGKYTLYKTNGYYGIDHAGFKEHLNRVESELSSPVANPSDPYKIRSGVYNDNRESYELHPNVTLETLNKLANKPTHNWENQNTVRLAASHHNMVDPYLMKLFENHSEHVASGAAIRNNPNIGPSHIDAALDHPHSAVYYHAIRHKNATVSNMEKAANSEHDIVRVEAHRTHKIQNPSLLQRGLKDRQPEVRRMAASSPHLNADHKNYILTKNDHPTLMGLAQNKSATADDLSKILEKDLTANDPHPSHRNYDDIYQNKGGYAIRREVFANHNSTDEHVERALNSADPAMRYSVFYKDPAEISKKHIERGLTDSEPAVRAATFRTNSPLITPEHIDRELNTPDEQGQSFEWAHRIPNPKADAIKHPNASFENISKALRHPNDNVFSAALISGNLALGHLDQLAKDIKSGKETRLTTPILNRIRRNKQREARIANA